MDLLKPLIARLAVVNPIGTVPFFLGFTQGLSREQGQRTLRVSAFSAFCVIAVSALAGLHSISFFDEKTRSVMEHAVLVGCGVVIGLATYAAFAASGRIAKLLGCTGIHVMPRLICLIVAAMAVELPADGLAKRFPILASPTLR